MARIELPKEKRVRHLTLLRQSRPLSPREFNVLSAAERLEIIGRSPAREKLQLLIEAADAEELVPQLPAQDLYLMVREVGFEAALDILQLADSEQLTLCLDLDAWQDDRLDGPTLIPWLQVLLSAGDAKLLTTLREIDFELLVLMFKKHLRVVATPGDIEDEDARHEAERQDGGYRFEFRDPEHGKLFATLLRVLLRDDQDFCRELLEAVRWEADAELEESVYRQRRVRLAEQGFPDPVEAREIYARLTPGQLEPAGAKGRGEAAGPGIPSPGTVLSAAPPRDLLAEVLAAGLDEATAWELTYLVNKVMMADRVDVGDAEQVRQVVTRTYATLNLALEYLVADDSQAATETIHRHYLEHLFRLGYGLVLELRERARALAGSGIGPYLEGPFRGLVAALRQPFPAFYAGLENPEDGSARPFATRRELDLAGRWLDRLELLQRLFGGPLAPLLPSAELDLTGCAPDDPADLVLSDLLLTALANRLLGSGFALQPVPRERLSELQGLVCSGDRLRPELRAKTRDWLEGLEPGAGAFADDCLDLWEDEFCPLAADQLDPRFLGGLIVSDAAG